MKNDCFEQQAELQAPARHDNQAHRALFSLPPITLSDSTALTSTTLPTQRVVTGDVEIDAVLWLREVISTGQADLIRKAKEAAARIKTPLEDLEKKYSAWLRRAHPGNWVAVLSSIGFADLDRFAEQSIKEAIRRHEAHARFGEGDAIFNDTPAEEFCIKALKGLRVPKGGIFLDAAKVDARFDALLGHRPVTLDDCLSELRYWNELYWMRNAVGTCDHAEQVSARDDYVFRCLARIPPRDIAEAARTLDYLIAFDRMRSGHTPLILFNLIGAPKPYSPEGTSDGQ